MDFNKLKSIILSDKFRITLHALREKDLDNLSIDEIKISMYNAKIIEDYPESKPFASCLVLSFNSKNDPIHSVWGYDETIEGAILITVYRPNPEKWVEYKKRK